MIDIKLESDDLKELIKARIEFNKAVAINPIEKDASSNRGDYLSLETLQEKTNAIMNPLGLYIDQTTICDNGSEYLITTLNHTSGQFRRSVGWLFKEENEMTTDLAKEFGGIMTYKQRYQWRSMLGIGRGSQDAETMDSKRNKKTNLNQQASKSTYAKASADTPTYAKASADTPARQPTAKPAIQQTIMPAEKKPIEITFQHQQDIMNVLKTDPEAMQIFCLHCKVKKISDLKDEDFDAAYEVAQDIAQEMEL